MPHSIPTPGDVVWIRQRRWRVERARRTGNVIRLDVATGDRRMTFLAPFDRPAVDGRVRLRRARPQQAFARLAHELGHARGLRSLPSVVGARIDVLPHQLEPALALLNGARRVLVADDVGLGKTIQSGIAIAEVIARHPSARVLVLAPEPLCGQWQRELSNRFGIESIVADRITLNRLAREGAFGDSPWRRRCVWIASLDFIKQPHVACALPLEAWDLLVVDEAHTACGESDRHAACRDLACRSRRVLLLSATPHSGDDDRFARLLDLGRLGGAGEPLAIFRRTRAGLGMRVDRAVRWHRVRLADRETQTLAILMAFEAAVVRAAGAERREAALLLLSVFRKRALSTMAALVASLERRLAWLSGSEPAGPGWTQSRLDFDALDDDLDRDERAALGADVGLAAADERAWLHRLLNGARQAARVETKIHAVAALIHRAPEPVVVFTEFRDSLQALAARIGRSRAIAVLHGGLTSTERARQLDRFLNGDATALLSTDVAGQGLNLQTRARWVISLELPWNPARLEQRVGRVDRIGQTRRVHFTLVVARGDAEAGLLARVASKVLRGREVLGADWLGSVMPRETALRRALVEGRPLPDEPSGAPLPFCSHWRRPARVISRRTEAARALASRWRGPAPHGGIWTRTARLPNRLHAPDRAVAVFLVPLVNRTGDVVERLLAAVDIPGIARGSKPDRVVLAAAGEIAAARLGNRAKRLARLVDARAVAEAQIERDLAARLREAAGPREIQAGLFDRRAIREFDRARSARAAIDESIDSNVRHRTTAASIEVGRPALAVAFLP